MGALNRFWIRKQRSKLLDTGCGLCANLQRCMHVWGGLAVNQQSMSMLSRGSLSFGKLDFRCWYFSCSKIASPSFGLWDLMGLALLCVCNSLVFQLHILGINLSHSLSVRVSSVLSALSLCLYLPLSRQTFCLMGPAKYEAPDMCSTSGSPNHQILHMGFSINREPQNRSRYTMII